MARVQFKDSAARDLANFLAERQKNYEDRAGAIEDYTLMLRDDVNAERLYDLIAGYIDAK